MGDQSSPSSGIDAFRQHPSERPKRPKPTRKRVWASLTAGTDAFIADVKAEMTRRDPDHERTWVILTDGERALQRRVIASFENVTLVLDLLHVLDKLWKVAHALHQKAAPKPKRSSGHGPNGSCAGWPARSSKDCARS